MPHTTESERIQRLKEALKKSYGHDPASVRVIRSPYRICPLGAHIDHQHGKVTGMCIDRSVLLAYVPNLTGKVRLLSSNFNGATEFALNDSLIAKNKDWGNYAKGAVFALRQHFKLQNGIDGIIEGNLPIGGLSSSAAVGIAYLLALENANDLQISREENIHLDRAIENDFIGLRNGILDQSTILLSRKNKLFHLDCQSEDYCLISPDQKLAPFKVIVVYSGISQTLVGTGYNTRVAECQTATKILLEKSGKNTNENKVLRDVPESLFDEFKHELPENERKRATHFFAENARVDQGVSCWRNGNLREFGNLINASGLSSIRNYECGSPHLITIYELLSETEGVYGARFSGAGFRGSCIGLIDPAFEDSIIDRMEGKYPEKHTDIKHAFKIFTCNSDEGANNYESDRAGSRIRDADG
jgi:galactokinase